jgi:predicted nuclease with TOPRIM domain
VESQSQDLVQTVSLVALAAIGLVVGVQKLLKDWRSTEAETNIIQLMHTEIERMGEQNTKLSTELGKLQEEVIRLNQELSKLNIENSKLQEEIAQLTLELTRFKQMSRG